MKNVTVRLDYLDKVSAIIINETLPVLLNNHPNQNIGTCKVYRDNNGICLGFLELQDNVDEELFFYYTSLNTNDGGFWFSGLSLATEPYREKIPSRLKDMIMK